MLLMFSRKVDIYRKKRKTMREVKEKKTPLQCYGIENPVKMDARRVIDLDEPNEYAAELNLVNN